MAREKGFTLIELLVVVAIIGILAAIAIPQFAEYRRETYCARVTSDAKNAFVSMEAYFADQLTYGTLADTEFTSTENVAVIIQQTGPLIITATDTGGQCVGTYTLSEASGLGAWR